MENPAVRTRLAVLVVSAAALIVACGGDSKKAGTTVAGIGQSDEISVPRVDPSLCDTSNKKVSTFDLNGDNEPDVWKLYATVDEGGTTVEIMTCKQSDLDHDGKKDYVATYSRTGEIIAEEFDFDFDGRFDAREHYNEKSGRVFLVERDSDHDKKPDVWEKRDDAGRLESVRRDRNADGKPDYWEQYKEGVLVGILYDDDFDNRVDRKDQAPDVASDQGEGEDSGAEGEAADDSTAPVDESMEADAADPATDEAGDEAAEDL